jgi:hypothetical protein
VFLYKSMTENCFAASHSNCIVSIGDALNYCVDEPHLLTRHRSNCQLKGILCARPPQTGSCLKQRAEP